MTTATIKANGKLLLKQNPDIIKKIQNRYLSIK